MTISIQKENFDSIGDEWECILPRTGANTIFITPWWQQLWWRRYGNSDASLEILSVRKGDSLLGIAPLMTRGDTLSFLGDTDLFDYHDFLVREGCEDDFYATLWQHIETMDWKNMELKSLRESSETLRASPLWLRITDGPPTSQRRMYPLTRACSPLGTSMYRASARRTATNSAASCAVSPTATRPSNTLSTTPMK